MQRYKLCNARSIPTEKSLKQIIPKISKRKYEITHNGVRLVKILLSSARLHIVIKNITLSKICQNTGFYKLSPHAGKYSERETVFCHVLCSLSIKTEN